MSVPLPPPASVGQSIIRPFMMYAMRLWALAYIFFFPNALHFYYIRQNLSPCLYFCPPEFAVSASTVPVIVIDHHHFCQAYFRVFRLTTAATTLLSFLLLTTVVTTLSTVLCLPLAPV